MKFSISKDNNWLILDPDSVKDELDFRQLEISLTKKIKNYFFHPLVKKKIWDGSVNFFFKQRFVPVGLWNELIKIGKQHRLDIEIDGLDKVIDQDLTLEEFTAVVNEHFEGHKIQPRDYQIESAWRIVKYKLSVSELATSAGKTLVVYLVLLWLHKTDQLEKFLMIVPNKSLVSQALGDFQEYGAYKLGFKFGEIHGEADKLRADANVVIGTYQSLVKYEPDFLSRFNVVCVDEAHQTNTVSIKNIIGKCKQAKWRFGLTGTLTDPGTADHFTIQSNLGPMVMQVSADFLFQNKYATPVDIKVVQLDYLSDTRKAQLLQLRSSKSDMDGTEVFRLEQRLVTESRARLKFICDMIGKTTKNSLVLFQSVQEGYGKAMYDRIREMYPDKEVYYVDGGTKQELREEYKRRLEEGTNRILIATFGTFSTGISIKNLHNIFLTESFKSDVLIGQSLGRMMRLHGDKDKAMVIDFVDDYTWNGKKNYLMKHSDERIILYDKKKFPYKIYRVKIKPDD